MNFLYILLLVGTSVHSELHHLEYPKVQKNQTLKKEAIPKIHLPLPATDTPEVKAARKAHENAYNYIKSTLLAGQTSKRHHQIEVKQTDNSRQYLASNQSKLGPHDPLVQSYINNTLQGQKVRKIESPNKVQEVRNHHKISLSQDKNNNDVTVHKQKSEQHLKALRNVIALQLSSYQGHTENSKVPKAHQVETIDVKKATTVEKSKSKKRHVLHDYSNKELYKKLAVIAAAEALMKILDA